jgi:hypothetical protein
MSKCENCGFENDDENIKCKRCHYLLKDKIVDKKNYDDDNQYGDASTNNLLSFDHNQFTQDNQGDTVDINNQPNLNEDAIDNYHSGYSYDEGYFLLENVESIDIPENDNDNSKKSLVLGCLLSFFITGMGNVYAGLTKRGIIEFIISLIINAFIPMNSNYMVDFNSVILYISLIWSLYVIYDTYVCIKAINNNEKIPSFLGFMDIR